MRVLVVGMNPSALPATMSVSVKRLYDWADRLGIGVFSFVNAWHSPGDVRKQELDLDFLRGSVTGHEKVVALGVAASRALSRAGINHHMLPHPSGLNRILNDPEAVDRALSSCASFLENDHGDTLPLLAERQELQEHLS